MQNRATAARRYWALTGATALLVALTSCVNVDAKMSLNAKAEATGQMRLAMAKQAASMVGITDLESFKSQMQQESAGKAPPEASMSYEESADAYAVVAEFRNMRLTDSGMSATALNNTIEFKYFNKGTEGDTGGLGEMNLGAMKLEVSFPGKLLKVTGAKKVDGNTIRYSGPLTRTVTITATSSIDAGLPLRWLGFGTGPLALLAGCTAVVIMRRRSTRRAPKRLQSSPRLWRAQPVQSQRQAHRGRM